MVGYRASESMLDIALSALPLRIAYAELSPDPILVLRGPGWGSNFMCNWVLQGDGHRIDRNYDGDVVHDEDEILTANDLEFLLGREVVGITSNPDMIDPVFHISGGLDLVVHADTPVDPWMLRLPDITLVGTAAK